LAHKLDIDFPQVAVGPDVGEQAEHFTFTQLLQQ
jgi:hypothetical protein